MHTIGLFIIILVVAVSITVAIVELDARLFRDDSDERNRP